MYLSLKCHNWEKPRLVIATFDYHYSGAHYSDYTVRLGAYFSDYGALGSIIFGVYLFGQVAGQIIPLPPLVTDHCYAPGHGCPSQMHVSSLVSTHRLGNFCQIIYLTLLDIIKIVKTTSSYILHAD